MEKRTLGSLSVGKIGLGCMGMSEFYGPGDDAMSLKVLARALELGVTLFDTADMYGSGANEQLLGRFFKENRARREEVVLATKFGIRRKPGDYARSIDNSPAYIREACEASLKRLGVDCLDLYYIHRIEPGRPIEEPMAALAELVKQGKIRAIGLSEPSAATLEKAHKVHPVAAVESEYSLWTRNSETDGVFKTCQKLGIGFVAYSPLGRGFLTGTLKDMQKLAKGDFRNTLPRMSGEHLEKNLKLLGVLDGIAVSKGCSLARLVLAWILSKPWGIVPIPGTKRIKYLEDNAGAESVKLTPKEIKTLDAAFPVGADYGPRYTPEGMKGVGA
jgi:aryl-alcohol dehydrogenase-like predicted oxidoreductase